MRERDPNVAAYVRNYQRLYPMARLAVNVSRRLNVTGTENIPAGPAVIAANHSSIFDPLYLALAYYEETQEPLRFLAKRGYFDGKGTDDKGKFGQVVKFVMNATGQIPVDRGGRGNGGAALDAAVQALTDDEHAIGIFPEGTLVEPGKQARFHAGAAQIALRANVPLVPVAITPDRDTNGELKPDGWLAAINVRFGEPVDTESHSNGLYHIRQSAAEARFVTTDLEASLAALTGYTRTGAFAKPGELRRRHSRRQR